MPRIPRRKAATPTPSEPAAETTPGVKTQTRGPIRPLFEKRSIYSFNMDPREVYRKLFGEEPHDGLSQRPGDRSRFSAS